MIMKILLLNKKTIECNNLSRRNKMKIEYDFGSVSNFKLLGFATGKYKCICACCNKEFMGDKRSTMCLECAIAEVDRIGKEFSKICINNNLKENFPANATNLEVFAVKKSKDSPTGLQAFLGFYVNDNFNYIQVPFLDHPLNDYNSK